MISCDPNDLAEAAKCFQCVNLKSRLAIKTYLLCQYANGTGPAPPPTPDPPTELLIDFNSSSGNIVLNWTAPAVEPTTYEIWRSVNGGAYALVASVAGNLTTYTHAAAMPANDQWYYEVRSCNGVNCSAFTDPAGIFQRFVHTANTGLLTYDFPFLQIVLADFDVSSQAAMTSISLPILRRVRGYFGVYSNSVLATLNTDSLIQVDGVFCQVAANSPLTTIDLPGLITVSAGYFNVQTSATLTTLNIPVLATVAGNFYCALTPLLDTISAPSLTTIGGDIQGSQAGCSTFSMPLLVSIGGTFNLNTTSNLTTLNLNSLASIFFDFNISGTGLATMSLPAITTVDGLWVCSLSGFTSVSLPVLTVTNGDFTWNDCPALVNFTAPNVIFLDNSAVNFDGCGLNDTSVNEVLARGVASATTGASYELANGTNAAPTGQGILDAATLVGSGNTVNTN